MGHTALAMMLAAGMAAAAQPATPSSPQPAPPPAPTQEPARRPKPPTVHRVAAGDLDGDGRAELIRWNSDDRQLTVASRDGRGWTVRAAHDLANFPGAMVVADLDGDGRNELLIGEGLRGYNPKDGPQTDVQIRSYRPLAAGGWEPVELYRQATERPEVTTLQVTDLDGDAQPEILAAHFSSKYFVDLVEVRRSSGSWQSRKIANVRMGPYVAAGDVMGDGRPRLVVGRPYGDPLPPPPSGSGEAASPPPTVLGDAFILDGTRRIALPVHRGVSGVAVGDLDADGRPEIVVGDGWHSDFGKVARGRLAILKGRGETWDYEFVEDVPEQIRLREITLVDLTGDDLPEIVVRGDRKSSLGGAVRVYRRTSAGKWQATTLTPDVQAFAAARFEAGPSRVALAGPEPVVVDLDAGTTWDTELAQAVETYKVDHKTLVGKPAPRLSVKEWVGGEPTSLQALAGKVVLLDFWATWCKPCIAQFPRLREWQAKFGPDLVILGPTNLSSQSADDVRAFYAKHQLPWPVAIDPDDRTHMEYGVSPIPHSFVIGRDGTVRLSHVGGGKLDQVETAIIEALAQPVPPR